ncbi:hypothetical protein [Roseofilum casamattae]|uniref:Restriction endonuclease subunit R n=1 Tax=Roseofilum casamattae BLCC-M143 TaxID=3022442 RepID=A0ABT7BT55_9CYAN|nr:hypothetical protein [Roseofilum casamattae]MDJ1182364.1 restriction endonuclease subunit R [Roseofilum casamattae BLCC-M143]
MASLSLSDLKEKCNLARDRQDPFFQQWLIDAQPLSSFEQQLLNRLQVNYSNLIETAPVEEIVKLVVVAPLLDLAGFYRSPFSLRAEVPTALEIEDSGLIYKGRIDILVICRQLWVLAIESKQSRLDVTVGIPQALSYLLSQSRDAQIPGATASFAMVTNGRELLFLKLSPLPSPTYNQSKIYQIIDSDNFNNLGEILQGLKWMNQHVKDRLGIELEEKKIL